MDDQPRRPLPDPSGLARALSGAESELSLRARSLVEGHVVDLEVWYDLVEQAAMLLRRTARDLEAPGAAGGAEPGDAAAPADRGPASTGSARKPTAGEASGSPARAARPAPTSAEGVVSGHASVVPVSDLLAFLSGLRRSGMLWVETEREGFLVQLHEGAVVYAQGDNPPRGQLLGEILVAEGALAREDLERALPQAAEGHEVLGAWLVRQGEITSQELTRALTTQVQMIFDRMFGSPDARWQFEDGVRMVETVDVRLNAIQLLLESARASDESHAHSELGLGLPLARVA